MTKTTATTTQDETTPSKSTLFQTPTPRWRIPIHADVCSHTGVTLSRYMMEMARLNHDPIVAMTSQEDPEEDGSLLLSGSTATSSSTGQQLRQLESIMTSIQTATKTISNLVRRSALTGMTGYCNDASSSINVHGETQKKLDVITNDVLKKSLKWSGQLATLASEEEECPVSVLQDGQLDSSSCKDASSSSTSSLMGDVLVDQEGDFVAVFDPLDGSSNVDVGIPVGTIFGIYWKGQANEECVLDLDALNDDDDDDDSSFARMMKEAELRCLQQTLQPGKNLVAAGYCLYSSATMLVLTLGSGVHGFTLDETIGEFVLTHPDMRIPSRGNIVSMNESNRRSWDVPLQRYLHDRTARAGGGEMATSRYVGSMVADVHRTLLTGGMFAYPADDRHAKGKLRLLYEAAPMGFLMEQAGGCAASVVSVATKSHEEKKSGDKNSATTTTTTTTRLEMERILDIVPSNVHQRVSCFLGSSEDMAELETYYRNYAAEQQQQQQQQEQHSAAAASEAAKEEVLAKVPAKL